MSVLFFDPRCPESYSARTFGQSALGGTEATTIRVAEALDAVVVQHNRIEADGRYRPPGACGGIRHVVVLQDPQSIAQLRETYPRARFYLWVHNGITPGSKRGRLLVAAASLLCDLEVTIVCVSNYQRADVEATLEGLQRRERISTRTIYNAVDDQLVPDGSPVDPSKLIFFSSPDRGLAYTLDAFQALRRRMPDLRLQVGNPGYKHRQFAPVEGVEWLGSLPYTRIIPAVRTALCTFTANFSLETFGLVYAESKAVGTPVLAHDVGAATEVLNDPALVLPVTRLQRLYEDLAIRHWRPRLLMRLADRIGVFDAYAERISAWRAGARPRVGPDPRFRLTAVAQQWRNLLAH